MTQLACDTNSLLDVMCGDIVREMFSLRYEYIVPHAMLRDELSESQRLHMLEMGLRPKRLSAGDADRVRVLNEAYPSLEAHDSSILVLAESEMCALVTGDADLRLAAKKEQIWR